MNKTIIAVVVLVVVIIGGYFLFREGKPAVTESPTPTASASISETPSMSVAPSTSPSTSATATPKASLVLYTDTGFSPATVTIKTGEAVTWKNNSSHDLWVASGVHPLHTLYPIAGGCIGSIFDACTHIKPGALWSFTFTVVGTWGYHDHLNARFTGKVIVTK